MSEWVVLQVLLHHRQFRRYDRQQREKIWDEDEAQPAARDVRVGLLGLGVLGRDAARKLQRDRLRRRRLEPHAEDDRRASDAFTAPTGSTRCSRAPTFSSALLPLTPETRGLLNAALFAKLPRDGRIGGPALINARARRFAGRGRHRRRAGERAC